MFTPFLFEDGDHLTIVLNAHIKDSVQNGYGQQRMLYTPHFQKPGVMQKPRTCE